MDMRLRAFMNSIRTLGCLAAVSCWVCVASIVSAAESEQVSVQSAEKAQSSEDRFFADCPRGQRVILHDEQSPVDMHSVLYTTLGLLELEVVRVADWLIDLLWPGPGPTPFRKSMRGVRGQFSKLPHWTPVRRLGELVDALQLPELSISDATATYSLAGGGERGPAGGILHRADRLIDWTQHVTGDINRAGGWILGQTQGLIPWAMPERLVDGTQWLVIRTFNTVSIMATRAIDQGINSVEMTTEGFLNIAYRRPHRELTVFLRLPTSVYRAHELWFLEHNTRVIIGTPEAFAQTTHARLGHGRRRVIPDDWPNIELAKVDHLVVMLSPALMQRAPEFLHGYVVPAAWVLGE